MFELNKKSKYICGLLGFAILFYIRQIVDTLANPDAIWNGTIYKNSWGWECGLGRYLIKYFQDMRCNVVNSAIASIICLTFICIACAVLTEIFEIKSGGYNLYLD